jgi:hypothetical protein
MSGYKYAKDNGLNLWTGKEIKNNNSLPTKYYPDNDGFLGDTETKYLMPGDIVDRYGGTTNTSRFVSPQGTPIESRSLPPSTNLDLYNTYKVIKPFPVQSGTVAPYYGQSGCGIQYTTPLPINVLIKRGILTPYLP